MRTLGSLLVLAACAHTPNLDLRPENPAPQGQEVASFDAFDGTKLWRRKYWPKAFAGVGPYIRGALLDAGGDSIYQVTAGVALYGAD